MGKPCSRSAPYQMRLAAYSWHAILAFVAICIGVSLLRAQTCVPVDEHGKACIGPANHERWKGLGLHHRVSFSNSCNQAIAVYVIKTYKTGKTSRASVSVPSRGSAGIDCDEAADCTELTVEGPECKDKPPVNKNTSAPPPSDSKTKPAPAPTSASTGNGNEISVIGGCTETAQAILPQDMQMHPQCPPEAISVQPRQPPCG